MALTTLTLALMASSFSTPALQAPVVEVDVPYMLRVRENRGTLRNSYQEGRIRVISPDKRLVIDWLASPLANQAPNWTLPWNAATNSQGNAKVETASQVVTTRFFPTDACVLGPHSMLIGGITATGVTVIDKLDFEWPSMMPVPVTNQNSGLIKVPVTIPAIAQTTRIYSATAPGRHIIKNMCAIRKSSGVPELALVQFFDSNDVYSFSIANGALSLLASATDASASFGIVSALSSKDDWGIWAGDHASAGFVYIFQRFHKLALATQPGVIPPTLLLVDSNRDGTIDTPLQLSPADFRAQGWWNLDHFVSWWLNF